MRELLRVCLGQMRVACWPITCRAETCRLTPQRTSTLSAPAADRRRRLTRARSNGNGTIERGEFVDALGDVGGADGDTAKAFVFGRVDHLSGSGGHLNASSFANALVLMRTLLLGY